MPDLADAVAGVAAALSRQAVETLAGHLEAGSPPERIRAALPAPAFAVAVDRLLDSWSRAPSVSGSALSLALRAVLSDRRDRTRLSLVWTGPTTDAVPVRRTDQALLQLINRAHRRVIIMSFAVYRVPNVAATLRTAVDRGVRVDLVVESEAASGGKIGFDGWAGLATAGMTLWTWASDRRPVTSSGSLATLHAKCAVADERQLLVSSANLTAFALSVNMELGLLVTGDDIPVRVTRHLDQLMRTGELVPVAEPG